MSLKVVALTGSKGSGKDTVGQLITDAFGGQTIAFADPIKNVVEHIFQLPVQGVGWKTITRMINSNVHE